MRKSLKAYATARFERRSLLVNLALFVALVIATAFVLAYRRKHRPTEREIKIRNAQAQRDIMELVRVNARARSHNGLITNLPIVERTKDS